MFTRRGDAGETDTGSRKRVTKASAIIEIEGHIDSVNSFLGLAWSKCQWDDMKSDIALVQEDLFVIGEELTAEGKNRTLADERLKWLEARTLDLKGEAGKIKLFVMPGGSEISALFHVCRTQSRLLERTVVHAREEVGVRHLVLSYLNRLSSLLFMHSVVANVRLGVSERIWSINREI